MKEYCIIDWLAFTDFGKIINDKAKEGWRVVSHAPSNVPSRRRGEADPCYSVVLERDKHG